MPRVGWVVSADPRPTISGAAFCLILATLGTEALLALFVFAAALADSDSGTHELAWAGLGSAAQMPILLAGGLACVVRSPTSLRLATLLGVVLLLMDAVLLAANYSAFPTDFNNPFVLVFLLPSVVVLGGVWLMRGGSRDSGAW